MQEQLKKILTKPWIVYLALALSYLFKGLYAYGVMSNYVPSYLGGADLPMVSSKVMKATVYLTMCFSETLTAVIAANFVQFILARTGRAFMDRRNFVLSVGVYLILANVVLGFVGLTYFISPIIYVFVPKIASIIVYTVAFGIMFWRMYKTGIIPEYMVARAFQTMAIPYFVFSALMML